MYFQLILGLSVLCAWSQAIPCNCGLGIGRDICKEGGGDEDSSCVPLVIRPAPPPYVPISKPHKPVVICKTIRGGAEPLKPVVGLCSCGQTVITPAHNPVPVCRACGGRPRPAPLGPGVRPLPYPRILHEAENVREAAAEAEEAAEEAVEAAVEAEAEAENAPLIGIESLPLLPAHPPHPSSHLCHIPADPVSQALALREFLRTQNIPRNAAADRDIAFGFKKIPTELVREKQKDAILEGNLQQIKGQVLELKPVTCVRKTLEEEAIEDLLAEEDEAIKEDCGNIRSPSFGELGFISRRERPVEFIDLEIVKEKPSCTSDLDILPNCKDGYRPGQVIVKEGRQHPPVLPLGLREPICLENERIGPIRGGVIREESGVIREGPGVYREESEVIREGPGVIREVIREGPGVIREVIREGPGPIRGESPVFDYPIPPVHLPRPPKRSGCGCL